MFNKIKKWLKQKWVRIFILSSTIIGAVLTISLGSSLYTSQHINTSIEYGGGARISIKVVKSDGQKANAKLAKEALDNIVERFDPTGTGISQHSSITKDGRINIEVSSTKTSKELEHFKEVITTKPVLGIYDRNDNPYFENGEIRDPNAKKITKDDEDSKFRAPFSNAKVTNQGGEPAVIIKLKNEHAKTNWTILTKKIAKKKNIVIWLDHQKLWKKWSENPTLKDKLKNNNLLNSIYVNNKHLGTWEEAFLKEGFSRPKDYMISNAKVNSPLTGDSFVITGVSSKEAKELAAKINYGISNYKLEATDSHFINAEYGPQAFHKAMIAGIVVFSLIALFMIVNYGLLGALSTISISLYMFLTLTLFTVMRGEYSPESIAALIIGIGMSVDANIITFERLKKELTSGTSIKKANFKANKLSFSSIFDANITTLIAGFVLFYFGTASIKGFSIMLILSVLFTLIVMLCFTRTLSNLFVQLGLFDKRLWLLGLRKKSIKNKQQVQTSSKFNYMKNSKWFAIGSSIFVVIATITFSISAGIAGTISSGVNSSMEFSGGSIRNLSSKNFTNSKEVENLKNEIIKNTKITSNEIHEIYSDENHKHAGLSIKTKKDIKQLDDIIKKHHYNWTGQTVTSDVAKALVKDAMIAITIAILAIVLYTLIRFKWTFSISAILALVHDGLIVTAVFIISRIELSPIFVAGILSVIGYSINDTIVTFDRIREKLANPNHKKAMNKKELFRVANEAIRDTIKRSILTSLTTITAILVLMMFGNATKLSFNVAMLVGVVSGTYSSIFIATYMWALLETFSQKRSEKRRRTQFWKLRENEEQTIIGINDFED